MHAIREVDVGMTRGPEHHLVARPAPPAERMRRQVVRSQIGLDLDQASPQLVSGQSTHQYLAEQLARDLDGVAVEERRLRTMPDGMAPLVSHSWHR